MEHLRCVVERITYQNQENGYTVIKCRAKGYQELVAVVGIMPDVFVGSVLSLGGQWHVDGKYGRQFSVETCEEMLPATVYGIEKYLGSGLIKGVGPKFAKRIVERFGKDTIRVIDETPDLLVEVEGIGEVRVERIKKSWKEQRVVKDIMVFLQGHDVTTAHATKIYKAYGDKSVEVVMENPYRLADDIWGIGFVTADTIAKKMGYGQEKYDRIRAGVQYTLNRISDEGHVYAMWDQLVSKASELLGVEEEYISITMDEMRRAGELIIEKKDALENATAQDGNESVVYLPPFFHAERGTAIRLKSILSAEGIVIVDAIGLAKRIEIKTGMDYDEIQERAIEEAIKNKVFVLTGGPGTGKTTTTLGIITAFREAGAKILLAAPTGRAAKRLSESTGMDYDEIQERAIEEAIKNKVFVLTGGPGTGKT
ncbi:MAG: Flp pilus assembly complex ATPase component TadA, partial [Lachnospiraceae bacterium]|nr:Flp pilus assembly complex ATPase component TadA [Lachnospiraceae bacterium]